VAAATLILTLIVTQTIQLVGLAWRLSPVLGGGLALLVGAVYVTAGVFTVRGLMGRPSLVPPSSSSPRARKRYEEQMLARLRANPECADMLPIHPGDLGRVLAALSARAGVLVENSSRNVFMSSAVAQSGSLETLLIVGAQFRMAARVAAVYWGPLSLRERLNLWKFLLTSGVIFVEVEELGIEEEARPILVSVVTAALGGFPGLQVLSHLLIDVWLRGGANALLTLRVGNTAMQYCTAASLPAGSESSAGASAWASERIGGVIRSGAKDLADRVTDAAQKMAKSGVGTVRQRLAQGARSRTFDPTRDYR
jgi:hypothetical protein